MLVNSTTLPDHYYKTTLNGKTYPANKSTVFFDDFFYL